MSKEQIIQTAQENMNHNPNTVQAQGLNLIRDYQSKIISEINLLREIIQDSKEQESAPSYDLIKERIFYKIQIDIEIIEKVNGLKSSLTPEEVGKISIPAKTNKVLDSTLLAKAFLEENFDKLYDNILPEGYQIDKPEILNSIEFNEKDIWGSGKAVQLQVALFYMATVITNKTKFAEIEFNLYSNNLHFADETAIAHIEPIAEELNLSQIEEIESFSWFFRDNKTNQAFLTVPGGYSFGGGRGSSRNPRDVNAPSKEQATHDCSSFVADVCKIETVIQFSTADQYIAWQISRNNTVFTSHKKYSSIYSTEIVEKFEAIAPTELEKHKDNPDLVYGRRVFKQEDKAEDSLGAVGGHTGIVLGFDNTGNSLIISTNREIDTKKDEKVNETIKRKVIGYGVQEVSSIEKVQGPNVQRPFFSQFKGLA